VAFSQPFSAQLPSLPLRDFINPRSYGLRAVTDLLVMMEGVGSNSDGALLDVLSTRWTGGIVSGTKRALKLHPHCDSPSILERQKNRRHCHSGEGTRDNNV